VLQKSLRTVNDDKLRRYLTLTFWLHLFYCSNIGGATINDVALDFWHSGQNREDIGMEDLEHRLRAETMESQGRQRRQV